MFIADVLYCAWRYSMMIDDRILTVEQTAALLQINYETCRRYLNAGKIPGRKIGKQWRVVESDLKRFIAEGHSLQQPQEA